MAVGGTSTEGFDVLDMRGVGFDIEMRRLPPGTVDAELLGNIDKILFDQKTKQYLQFVDEKTNEFYQDIPGWKHQTGCMVLVGSESFHKIW